MFSFLTDNGGDETNDIVTVGCESIFRGLESSEDDVSEEGGGGDGGVEAVDAREDVLAGLDGGAFSAGEDGIGAEEVEFFLGLDGGEGVDDEVFGVLRGAEGEGGGGEVLEEGGEEGDLEELVKGDSLEGRGSGVGKGGREGCVGESAVRLELDLIQSI